MPLRLLPSPNVPRYSIPIRPPYFPFTSIICTSVGIGLSLSLFTTLNYHKLPVIYFCVIVRNRCTLALFPSGHLAIHATATADDTYQLLSLSEEEIEVNRDGEGRGLADSDQLDQVLKSLSSKLDDLQTCSDLITKHGATLQRALAELEQLDNHAQVRVAVLSRAVNRALL